MAYSKKYLRMKDPNKEGMTAFMYLRFSSTRQRELSIEGQRDVCTEYAQKHNINILAEYVDRAKSARTENRADFRRLIRDACNGKVDCILVWRYDRFFRDRAESALYRKQLEAAGVRLISVTEFIPDGSAGIITQGMIETVAEYFSAKLSEDVMRGMTKAAEKGQAVGGKALGYRTGPDKRWHIDPVGAEVVKRIFEWYDSGQPMGQLADQLNAEGHKTTYGKAFTRTSFSTILRNKKYIGIFEYNGAVSITGAVPRIIEDDLFFRVQRRLEANRHRPGAYKAEVNYSLSGKLFCGLCGSPMTGTAGTSKTGARHYYYICNNRRAKKCTKKNEKLDLIEAAVLQHTLDLLTDENIAYIAVEVERRCAENSGTKDVLSSLRFQLSEVERKLKNIGNAIAQGIITETTKALLVEAEEERAAIRRQIEKANVQAALTVKAEAVACWLDGFRHGDRKNPDFRELVFAALVHSVYVYDDKIKIVFDPDGSNSVVVPYTAVQDIDSGPAGGVPGSYLDISGVPKRNNPNHIFPVGDGFGLFVYYGRTIKSHSPTATCRTLIGLWILDKGKAPTFWLGLCVQVTYFMASAIYRPAVASVRRTVSGKEKTSYFRRRFLCSRYLFSRPVTRQLSSAYMSLTSVFGMGTGGPS